MCGTFIDEVPQEFHRERKPVSEKLLEATEQEVPIIQVLTADDATADLNTEAVEQLMVLFQDCVSQALALEEHVHPAARQEWLREAITAVMDRSPASPSWGFVPTAIVARNRSPRKHEGKCKKARAPGRRGEAFERARQQSPPVKNRTLLRSLTLRWPPRINFAYGTSPGESFNGWNTRPAIQCRCRPSRARGTFRGPLPRTNRKIPLKTLISTLRE